MDLRVIEHHPQRVLEALRRGEFDALEIIGEAAKRIPEQVRQRYPDIPWKGMAGMRDRIIHGYDNVDLQIVWDVVKRDIPQLKPKIELLLQDYKG